MLCALLSLVLLCVSGVLGAHRCAQAVCVVNMEHWRAIVPNHQASALSSSGLHAVKLAM